MVEKSDYQKAAEWFFSLHYDEMIAICKEANPKTPHTLSDKVLVQTWKKHLAASEKPKTVTGFIIAQELGRDLMYLTSLQSGVWTSTNIHHAMHFEKEEEAAKAMLLLQSCYKKRRFKIIPHDKQSSGLVMRFEKNLQP